MIRSHLEALCNARSLEELWPGHTRRMAEFGFDRLIYGFTRYRTEVSLGDPEDFVILSNHHPDYIKAFLGDARYSDAPMLRWAAENEGAASWSMIHEMQLSKAEQKMLEFNEKSAVTAGYTVSFKATDARSKGAIALTARAGMSQAEVDEIWAQSGADIELINNIAHLKILSLPYTTPRRALTERQRETLQWVGDGKTAQDIALLMGVSVATVEKHLRLAREALSVETTAQAVMKAALLNQMFVMKNT